MVAFTLVEALSFVDVPVDDAETVGLVASTFWGAESGEELRGMGVRFGRDALRRSMSVGDVAALRDVYAACERVLSYPCNERDLFAQVTNGEGTEVEKSNACGKVPDLWLA